MSVYQPAIEDIDARIARLQAARAVLVDLGARHDAAVTPRTRQKVTGTHALVLAVVRDGSDKVEAIAEAAKIKTNTARVAVRELEAAGKVKREGKGRSTRYVAA